VTGRASSDPPRLPSSPHSVRPGQAAGPLWPTRSTSSQRSHYAMAPSFPCAAAKPGDRIRGGAPHFRRALMSRGDLGMSQQTKDLVEEPAAAAVAPGPARLSLGGKDYELPVVVGSEGEVGVDIQQLRAHSGAITLDPGYGNTGACESAITFIDGEAGILRYRG